MSAPTPNKKQAELIETTQGTVLVDAGAGTGKTFTIARRYLHILETRDVDIQDVVLITFTNNAAEEMRERILHLGDRPPTEIQDAPISTFHALAKRVLEQRGMEAPSHLGLQETLAPNFTVVENEVLERELFEDFLRGFRTRHPEHADRFATLYDPANLLSLIKGLAAKGIFPTTQGWYRDGEAHLDGDRDAFLTLFDQANAQEDNRQSKLRSDLGKWKKRLFLPEAPGPNEVRGAGKQVDRSWGEQAFDDDRAELKAFLHDVYLSYLDYTLKRNTLNFGFLLLFAYVLLVEDTRLREQLQVPYVMIDEFQDTSEIQIQLALLLCKQPNLCCVGDWKQAIYSFQYADVDNILDFEHRVAQYADALNQDTQRVPTAQAFTGSLTRIDLVENYRSTDGILRMAEEALVVPGTTKERLDAAAIKQRIVQLVSNAKLPASQIQAYQSDREVDLVLDRIQHMVGHNGYSIEDESTRKDVDADPKPRAPGYGDIAVLTRTRSFALRLQERAKQLGVPVAFEGGVEVFSTDPGKLLLAWLRILEDKHSDRGWAVVLEHAGYKLHEAEHILSEGIYPEDMWAFRSELGRQASIGAQTRLVFQRYGLQNGITEALVATLQATFEASGLTPSEIVRFAEDNLEAGTTVNVDDHPGGEVVTIQTIHAAKGLEYPIVIVADINQARFPSTGGGYPSVITYRDPVGLRESKRQAAPTGQAYSYDHWPTVLCHTALPTTDHDEERRLFYVAMSRAEQHLLLTATRQRASPFFTELGLEPRELDPAPELVELDARKRPDPLELADPGRSGPIRVVVGQLAGELETTGGRGKAFGQRLHDFAARYARAEQVEPDTADERHAAAIIDELAGTIRAEVPCTLPVEIDGERYVIDGTIDLLAESETTIHVVDWKTTPPGQGHEVYATQVGLYARAVQDVHPDKSVEGWVVYTEDGSRKPVPPLPKPELDALVDGYQARATALKG